MKLSDNEQRFLYNMFVDKLYNIQNSLNEVEKGEHEYDTEQIIVKEYYYIQKILKKLVDDYDIFSTLIKT